MDKRERVEEWMDQWIREGEGMDRQMDKRGIEEWTDRCINRYMN